MTKKNDPFGGAAVQRPVAGHRAMSVNGFTAALHMPQALASRHSGGVEVDQGLPPYAPRLAYKVDDIAAAPEDWQRSQPPIAASYMTAVKVGHGAWLDFNGNRNHEYDVAIQVSVQGINAISGLKVDGFGLNQYNEICPRHQVRLGHDRFCGSCNYRWPAQDYLTTAAEGSAGCLWLDGFRAADGTVRQFVFTGEEGRGVAEQLLGEERSFSIGVAFYRSVRPRVRRSVTRGGGLEAFGAQPKGLARSVDIDIAAGARIKQDVHADPNRLDYWEPQPSGVLYLYYVAEEAAAALIGARPVGSSDGFLSGLQTGHAVDPFAG